jgi:hypothetical protein
MPEDKPRSAVFCRVNFVGQPPETAEMREKLDRAMRELLETGTISPDLPDLLVQEEDGSFHSVKETAQERISALSQLISGVLGTLPEGVPAAKLRLAIKLINDLPRLLDRRKKLDRRRTCRNIALHSLNLGGILSVIACFLRMLIPWRTGGMPPAAVEAVTGYSMFNPAVLTRSQNRMEGRYAPVGSL